MPPLSYSRTRGKKKKKSFLVCLVVINVFYRNSLEFPLKSSYTLSLKSLHTLSQDFFKMWPKDTSIATSCGFKRTSLSLTTKLANQIFWGGTQKVPFLKSGHHHPISSTVGPKVMPLGQTYHPSRKITGSGIFHKGREWQILEPSGNGTFKAYI